MSTTKCVDLVPRTVARSIIASLEKLINWNEQRKKNIFLLKIIEIIEIATLVIPHPWHMPSHSRFELKRNLFCARRRPVGRGRGVHTFRTKMPPPRRAGAYVTIATRAIRHYFIDRWRVQIIQNAQYPVPYAHEKQRTHDARTSR